MGYTEDVDQYRGYDFDPCVGLYLPGRGVAVDAEQRVMTLPGGAPSYQFRADTVTLSAGNVATIPNRRGSDALVVAAGTLAAPAGDALFGGAQSIAFTGTQWLDSNLAASAWKFLHDGTGCELFFVYAPTTLNVAHLSGTNGVSGSPNQRGWAHYQEANGRLNHVVYGTSGTICASTTQVGAAVVNTAGYNNFYYKEGEPLEYASFGGATVGTVGQSSAAPDTAQNPPFTLRLGARVMDGAGPLSAKFAELLIFPRVLHEYERQIVREYIQARYGIAAPVLTGADREIMSLLPFSWLDAAAYNTSGGKVTAFLDRARPGHTFAQATAANQVLNPAADALFSNAVTAEFVAATQHSYTSSLAASAWAFLHNGAGCSVDVPHAATDANSATWALYRTSVTGGGASLGVAMNFYPNGIVTNGAIRIIDAAPGAAQVNVGVAKRLTFRYAEASSPDFYQKLTSQTAITGDRAGAPSASAPASSFVLGQRTSAVWGSFKLPGLVFFNRVLTAAEETRLSSALQSKYGVSA